MNLHVQYLTDPSGAKTAVHIPFREWEKFITDYDHLRQHVALKKQLTGAIAEALSMEKSKTKPMT